MADGIVTSHPATLARETVPRNPTYQPRLGSCKTSMSRVLNATKPICAPFLSGLSSTVPCFLVNADKKGVRVVGECMLQCCSMLERVQGNHSVVISHGTISQAQRIKRNNTRSAVMSNRGGRILSVGTLCTGEMG